MPDSPQLRGRPPDRCGLCEFHREDLHGLPDRRSLDLVQLPTGAWFAGALFTARCSLARSDLPRCRRGRCLRLPRITGDGTTTHSDSVPRHPLGYSPASRATPLRRQNRGSRTVNSEPRTGEPSNRTPVDRIGTDPKCGKENNSRPSMVLDPAAEKPPETSGDQPA
jgi:hypothetical protein